jgi:hypothetical protein
MFQTLTDKFRRISTTMSTSSHNLNDTSLHPNWGKLDMNPPVPYTGIFEMPKRKPLPRGHQVEFGLMMRLGYDNASGRTIMGESVDSGVPREKMQWYGVEEDRKRRELKAGEEHVMGIRWF